jgi:regulator of sigma E protease
VSWILVFAGFAALIILHEFGHFLAAKATGMRVERFFLFFPPKLVSIKRGETEYGIGAIPLGGFVKITGMNPEELEPREEWSEPKPAGLLERVESVDQEEGAGVSKPGEPLPPELLKRAYYNQPVWKRIVVIGAGPAMNILICFVVLFFLALGAEKPTALEVGDVQSNTPAATVLKPGDRLVSIDGIAPNAGDGHPSLDDLDTRAQRLINQLNTHQCAGPKVNHCQATTPATIVVIRDGKRLTLHATPFYDANTHPPRFRLGFAFQATGFVPENLSVPQAAGRSVSFMWDITSRTVSAFARIFQPAQRSQLSGVVGISDVAHQAIQFGAREALTLLAVISLSLAIINLFPFLPLDGGHIFWSLVEKVRGERVPFRIIERASAVGFLLILLLFVIGLSNDISRLNGQGFNLR